MIEVVVGVVVGEVGGRVELVGIEEVDDVEMVVGVTCCC